MQAAAPPGAMLTGASSESPCHSLANGHDKEAAVSAGAVASGNGASGPPRQADIKKDAEVPVAVGGRAREVAVKQEALSTNGESVSAHTCTRCVRCTRRAALLFRCRSVFLFSVVALRCARTHCCFPCNLCCSDAVVL